MPKGKALAASDSPFDAVEALDRELARLARNSGSLRLAIGLGLDALARTSGHAALSFASIEAYALERCEYSATWTRKSRRLAVDTQRLPLLRQALISGRTSWSMGLEIAKIATAEDEAQWLLISDQCTVSRFRSLVKELRTRRDSTGSGPVTEEEEEEEDAEQRCLLTVTCNREETWLFECARMVFRHIEGGTASDLVEAIVAEAATTLMALVPKDAADPNDLAPSNDSQNAWNRQLARYREEAESLCEPRVLAQKNDGIELDEPDDYDFTGSPECIDRALRQISAALAERDVTIGELAEKFWDANGWRRLRYATAAQYARERLGMSLSSIKDKRQLARRSCRLPHLKRVLRDGHIGYEAARIVAGIATPGTDAAWAERATRRTLVHLREDVRAAELLSRVERREAVEPPSAEFVTELHAFETAVVTGAAFVQGAAPQTPVVGRKSDGTATAATAADIDATAVDIDALWTAFAEARRAPLPLRSRARDIIRLRVRPEIRAMYRGVERLYLRHRPLPMSFFHFACLHFIETWVRALPPVAYADVYARDGLRCTNPTCTRRDCTPHHTRFRAHGGGEERTNLTTLCTWCHLQGVHGGRISVSGNAPEGLEWRLGQHTTVIGRERHRAA